MSAVAERHYRVDELAELWQLSPETIRRLFREEPGVIKIGTGLVRYRRRRPYLTLSIPESVALRVKGRVSR
jgi:DeoR/GlpR family transcriptional regulator of sugar metabolism